VKGPSLHMGKLPVPKFHGFDTVKEGRVPPLCIEVYGEDGVGKSHFAIALKESMAMCDTEGKCEHIMAKLGRTKYFKPKDWGDVAAFWNYVVQNEPSVELIVFDNSRDLRDWAELWTLSETGKKSLYSQQAGSVQYSLV